MLIHQSGRIVTWQITQDSLQGIQQFTITTFKKGLTMIKESNVISYKDLDGYPKIGKVFYLYKSVIGNDCIALTNGDKITMKDFIKIIV